MLNNPQPQSLWRQPRGMVKINNLPVPGLVYFEVDSNGFYQADGFHVEIVLSEQRKPYNWAWWASQTDLQVECLGGFPDNSEAFTAEQLTSLIIGNVDECEINPIANKIILTGRDLSSLFIETKTSEKFANQKTSQIAKTLAARHGLDASVTETTGTAGKFYEIDHVKLNDFRSEWDLLTALARDEGYMVFVKGKTLHFEPKALPNVGNPYVLKWQEPTSDQGFPQFNGTTLKFMRNMLVAKDIIVQVRSWNAKNKKGFTKTAKATHQRTPIKPAFPRGAPQTYSYVIPGLTPDKAQQKANSLLHELTVHEFRLEASLPADDLLTPQSILQVTGTNTVFDQIYYPDHIIRHYSLDDGYTMTVRAKNHSVESETLA